MNWAAIQSRIGAIPDGKPGPRTWASLFTAMGCRDAERAHDLGIGASEHLAKYDITTPARIAAFLGQTTHETGFFRYLREIWGPTATQRGYEGRIDLGNTHLGDGKRYMGRGLIQCTGRFNYREVGKRIGIDLEANPTLAERGDIAVLSAADWWHHHKCNELADAGNIVGLGRLINRGSKRAVKPANGEAERLALTAKARALLS